MEEDWAAKGVDVSCIFLSLQLSITLLFNGFGVAGRSAKDNKEAIVNADGLDLFAGGLAGLGGVVGLGE